MLLLVTRLAHGHKPFDWLFTDVPAGILFMVHLRGAAAAMDTTVAVALQN